VQTWNVELIGCIERDTFKLDPFARTALSAIETPPHASRTADRRAPLTAHFQVWQTFGQWRSFWQWYHVDLYGGAVPFSVALWLWDRTRTVRAHFSGELTSRLQAYNAYLTAGAFEIERESIRPPAEAADLPPKISPQCVPARSCAIGGRDVQ